MVAINKRAYRFTGKIWGSSHATFTLNSVGVYIFINTLTLKAVHKYSKWRKQIGNQIVPYDPIFVKIHTYVCKKNSGRINTKKWWTSGWFLVLSFCIAGFFSNLFNNKCAVFVRFGGEQICKYISVWRISFLYDSFNLPQPGWLADFPSEQVGGGRRASLRFPLNPRGPSPEWSRAPGSGCWACQ